MKKITVILYILAFIIFLNKTLLFASEKTIISDINCDTKISLTDAIITFQITAGVKSSSSLSYECWNGEKIGLKNSICILNYLSEKYLNNSIANLVILQTSDIHDHVSGFGPFYDYSPLITEDNDITKGGLSRLASIIIKHKYLMNAPLLLVDSGDFLMGTIYDLTCAENPIILSFFQIMEYDAITLGNHEFDWTPKGLANLLQNAFNNGFNVPIIATNMLTSSESRTDPSAIDYDLNLFIENGKIVKKKIIEKGKLTIGILGIMGREAELYAPSAHPVTFRHSHVDNSNSEFYNFIQEQVNFLKYQNFCDLIVILSHSGVTSEGYGEDIELAKNIDNIDIIASGHAHTATPLPFVVNNTLIFSPGEYGKYICKLDLKYNTDERQIVSYNYDLISVDDTVAGNENIDLAIKNIDYELSQSLMAMGLPAIYSLVARTAMPLMTGENPGESSLGNLTADANRAVANKLIQYSNDKTPISVGITSNGYIRDNIKTGKTGLITFSDIYNVLPLGISPGGTPGYPLMSVYLNAYEIRALCEIAVTVELGELNDEFYLNLSGVKYYYNPDADQGMRVQQVTIEHSADAMGIGMASEVLPHALPIDSSVVMDQSWKRNIWNNGNGYESLGLPKPDLFRVVMDLYMLQMIYALGLDPAYSYFSALAPVPKDKNGNAIHYSILSTQSYIDLCIDSDPLQNGVQELKEFVALMEYMKSFPEEEFDNKTTIPTVPYQYNYNYIQMNPRVNGKGSCVRCHASDKNIKHLTILQTSDLHHHASGYGPFNDYTPLEADNDSVTGGFARLAERIGRIKMSQGFLDIPCLLVDSGDFYMGTIYDLTGMENPLVFQFFQGLGYDAITLGNHEFDWTPDGLAQLISNAINNGFKVPIVASNIIFNSESTIDNNLEFIFNVYSDQIVKTLIKDYPNGIKVGIIGLLGRNAELYAPLAHPLSFINDPFSENYYSYIQGIVDELRQEKKCNIIVALSHSGVISEGIGEDTDLASNVSGIDIIASGHTHIETATPFKVNDTLIMAPGEYGKNLCRLDIEYNELEQKIVNSEFKLISIDDSFPGNQYMHEAIESANNALSKNLNAIGLPGLDSEIAKTSFPLTINEHDPGESGLGNLTADANRALANAHAIYSNDTNPYYIGISVNGYIRDFLYPGKNGIITFSDIYNVLPLGISPTKIPGYPLVSIYLNAFDIRNICEIAATVESKVDSRFSGEFYLNISGVKYSYNPTKIGTGMAVNEVHLYSPADTACTQSPIFTLTIEEMMNSNSKIVYRATINLYLLQMLYALSNSPDYEAFRTLFPIAKDKNGECLNLDILSTESIFSIFIDSQPQVDGLQELKEYVALWQYLSNMPHGSGGLPEIPVQSPYNQNMIPFMKRVLTNSN